MKANQEWFSVSDMVGMPGMPGTPHGVLNRVNKHKYVSRKRPFGKGYEYALSSLPAITQAYLKDVTSAAIRASSFKKKEAVAPVDSAQEAINTEAEIEEDRRGLAALLATAQRVPVIQGMEAFKGWLLARQRRAKQDGHSYPEQRARGALDEVAFFEIDMRSNNE